MEHDDIRGFAIAVATAANPRHSEADIIPLRDGRLLLGWTEFYAGVGADDGATWREGEHVRPAGGGCWEPAAVELRDGRVLMFLRTGLGGQYQTISADGGATWSEPMLSPLRGTAAPISIERIPTTGDLLAIWNNDLGSLRARNPLTAAISRDDGRTWEHCRNVASAPDDAFAYPSVTFAGDTALLTYFNYKDGISLFLKRIPVAWFYA